MATQILVQMSDFEWTLQAMHLACAMARNTHSGLALLHLMPVANPALLGTEVGVTPPATSERRRLNEYAMIAEDYGVDLALQPMQYESVTDALVQAAEHVGASVVFAHLSASGLPFWQRFRVWNLRRQLAAQGCRLFTLEQPELTGEWTPSVSLKASK